MLEVSVVKCINKFDVSANRGDELNELILVNSIKTISG